MDDLFDQLKSSVPLRSTVSPSPTDAIASNKYEKDMEQFNANDKSMSNTIRRESLPSPVMVNSAIKKTKDYKARSLSPPKCGANNRIKSLKIKLERKKIEEFVIRPFEKHSKNDGDNENNFRDVEQPKKMTPTKAQQKLFEPVKQKKSKWQLLKEFNIKPCMVRIHRDNLEQMAKEFKNKNTIKNDGRSKTTKRSSSDQFLGSPPFKKGKHSTYDEKSAKYKSSFFIKLSRNPAGKLDKKLKSVSKCSASFSSSSSSSVAQHNKIINSKFSTTTAPTKFSRSHLIRCFGKRFFNVQVKIERCTHPLMLTFESNDRARRLQSKRNKSKNLSVSFREQVEIFGSSDSDDSYDEDFCAIPNRNVRKSNSNQSTPVPPKPVVMPARLKKVENGKVVDDIELDPSLFVDPKNLVSSTPFSPGRKKRDHKSFSPLKDESSPSPRKEQLKLANERIPPSGLRRINIDDDDEDDDCEYIVPIEMPQRRTSRTSPDGVTSTSCVPQVESITNTSTILNDNSCDKINLTTVVSNADNNINDKQRKSPLTIPIDLENGSDDSFQSAKDYIKDLENDEDYAKENDNELSELRVSPSSQFDTDIKNPSEGFQTNGDCDGVIASKQNFKENSKHLNTLNTVDDISMNLFLEDSQTNDDNHAKSFVDNLINETIDKLTKDIDENATDTTFVDTH